MICTICDGYGKLDDGNYAYTSYHNRFTKCGLCKGKGWITGGQAMEYARNFKEVTNP